MPPLLPPEILFSIRLATWRALFTAYGFPPPLTAATSRTASLATIALLQNQRAGSGAPPREVPGAAWGDEGGRGFLEHAIALGPGIGVMSWVVAVR